MNAGKGNKQLGFLHFILYSFLVGVWFIFDQLLSNKSKTFLYFKIVLEEVQENACMHAKSLQSCPTLCNPMDCSLPGSSVHGILQARTLE